MVEPNVALLTRQAAGREMLREDLSSILNAAPLAEQYGTEPLVASSAGVASTRSTRETEGLNGQGDNWFYVSHRSRGDR